MPQVRRVGREWLTSETEAVHLVGLGLAARPDKADICRRGGCGCRKHQNFFAPTAAALQRCRSFPRPDLQRQAVGRISNRHSLQPASTIYTPDNADVLSSCCKRQAIRWNGEAAVVAEGVLVWACAERHEVLPPLCPRPRGPFRDRIQASREQLAVTPEPLTARFIN